MQCTNVPPSTLTVYAQNLDTSAACNLAVTCGTTTVFSVTMQPGDSAPVTSSTCTGYCNVGFKVWNNNWLHNAICQVRVIVTATGADGSITSTELGNWPAHAQPDESQATGTPGLATTVLATGTDANIAAQHISDVVAASLRGHSADQGSNQ